MRAVVRLLIVLFPFLLAQPGFSATNFVSLVVADSVIVEGQETTFFFVISSPATRPIHIRYEPLFTMGAFLGRDYLLTGDPFVATIMPGDTSTTVTLRSIFRDGIQPKRVAGLILLSGKRYRVTPPDRATVEILNFP